MEDARLKRALTVLHKRNWSRDIRSAIAIFGIRDHVSKSF